MIANVSSARSAAASLWSLVVAVTLFGPQVSLSPKGRRLSLTRGVDGRPNGGCPGESLNLSPATSQGDIRMQWYETSEGWQRFLWECNFFQEDFPSIHAKRCDDGYMRASGILGPSNLSPRRMFIVAEFPNNYPNSRPRVFAPEEHFPPNTPHIYPSTDFELCIEHDDFTPDDTISTALGWSIQWLALYDNFLRTGERW